MAEMGQMPMDWEGAGCQFIVPERQQSALRQGKEFLRNNGITFRPYEDCLLDEVPASPPRCMETYLSESASGMRPLCTMSTCEQNYANKESFRPLEMDNIISPPLHSAMCTQPIKIPSGGRYDFDEGSTCTQNSEVESFSFSCRSRQDDVNLSSYFSNQHRRSSTCTETSPWPRSRNSNSFSVASSGGMPQPAENNTSGTSWAPRTISWRTSPNKTCSSSAVASSPMSEWSMARSLPYSHSAATTESALNRKRTLHNLLERRRRDGLRDSFVTLAELLPNLASEDGATLPAKVAVLQAAADHIRALKACNAQAQCELAVERRRNAMLMARLRMLQCRE